MCFAITAEGLYLMLTHDKPGRVELGKDLRLRCTANKAEKITYNKIIFKRLHGTVYLDMAKCGYGCWATRLETGKVFYTYKPYEEMIHYEFKWYRLILARVEKEDLTQWVCAYDDPMITSNILEIRSVDSRYLAAASDSMQLSGCVTTLSTVILSIIMKII